MKVVLSSHSSFYTGQKAHLVKKGEGSFTLKPGEKETLSMEVSPESYMDKVALIIEENLTEILPKVVDMCLMKNNLLVTVDETGQSWSAEDDFILEKPVCSVWQSFNYGQSQVLNLKDLGLRLLDNQLRVGRVFRLEIVFTNPLVSGEVFSF